MKRVIVLLMILVMTIALASMVFGADYSSMTTEELAKLRGTMRDAPAEERAAFRLEWQKRILGMTPEEQQKYLGPPAGAGRGQGRGTMGPGSGMGRGSGMGPGMGR